MKIYINIKNGKFRPMFGQSEYLDKFWDEELNHSKLTEKSKSLISGLRNDMYVSENFTFDLRPLSSTLRRFIHSQTRTLTHSMSTSLTTQGHMLLMLRMSLRLLKKLLLRHQKLKQDLNFQRYILVFHC